MEKGVYYSADYREYQTWLAKVNLDNIRSNYEHVQELGEQLLNCDEYDFKTIIKGEFFYHDTINWDAVNFSEIRESLADII